jgi:hypothetical protein
MAIPRPTEAKMRARRGFGAWGLCLLAFAVASGRAVRADVVLLDEYWSPEIMVTDVNVTEVDTEDTGDPTQAVSGSFSALLENETGAPNVRFRNVASLRPDDLPPDETELRVWYRTDAWAGKWSVSIWLYVPAAGRPVEFLQTDLDGGGVDGRLVADDQWHQARGLLTKGPEFEVAAGGTVPAAAYVWLRSLEGWDIAHKTYVDRVEAVIVSGPRKGELAPRPARHVRPTPGAQMNGPGFVLFEGEDVTGEPFPPGRPYLPDNADEQRLLSNGAWHQGAGVAGARAAWQFTIAEPGAYDLWVRGFWYRGDWRWRTDDGDWHVSGPGRKLLNAVHYRDIDEEVWGQPDITIAWTPLGKIDLAEGEHTLEIEAGEEALGFGFDCWVLARDDTFAAAD